MKTKKLGRFEVCPIGVGTWGVGGFMEPEYGNEDKDAEAIRYSINKGQNHIDTAEMYGNGHAEEIVAQAIKGLDRSKLFIASKVHRNYTKCKDVVRSTENILKRLNTDYLDLLYIHSYWEDEDMEGYLNGVNAALDNGLTKSIAVSNWSVDNLKWGVTKTKHPILANQMNYNILHQVEVPDEMHKLCKKEDIAIVAYRPLERKLLADQCDNETVLGIADKYKKTPSQIALNWLISKKNVHAIPKSTDKKHINENLSALDFELDREELNMLNNVK
jgi:diketogulonate reductase-like aldo/keto reductase